MRDIRELKDDPEAYDAALERRWHGLLSYRYIGSHYASVNDGDIDAVIREALAWASRDRRPVLVDVVVDYSKHTRFTQGIVKTNLERFDFGTKARLVGRALWRRLSG